MNIYRSSCHKEFGEAVFYGNLTKFNEMAKTGFVPEECFNEGYNIALVERRYEFYLPIFQFHPNPSGTFCKDLLLNMIFAQRWEDLEKIYSALIAHIKNYHPISIFSQAFEQIVELNQFKLLELMLSEIKNIENVENACYSAYTTAINLENYPCLYAILDVIDCGLLSNEEIVTDPRKMKKEMRRAIFKRRNIDAIVIEKMVKDAEKQKKPEWLIADIRKCQDYLAETESKT